MQKTQAQMGKVGRTILGSYAGLLSLLLIYLVVALWPTGKADASGYVTVTLFGSMLRVSTEVQLIWLVAVVAGLGSSIHMATSFADFAGARRLYSSWVWWYILRLVIGASLALVFYFVIRGGLLSVGTTAGELNTYGIAAVAGLVGMFSKQATDKLRELFDTLFKTEKPDQRGDKLGYHVPQITSIKPDSVASGTTGLSLKIEGDNFIQQSVVKLEGIDHPTNFISNTQLTVAVLDSEVAKPGEIEVTVFSPPPTGGSSNVYKLKVT